MAIGMSYNDYWYGDVLMVRAYREAYKLLRQREDIAAWRQGMYVYDAILRLAPVLRAFTKKNAKPEPYVDKPYSMSKEEKNGAITDEQIIKNEQLKAQLFFTNWARATAKKFQ